jgi:hypothetical protein
VSVINRAIAPGITTSSSSLSGFENDPDTSLIWQSSQRTSAHSIMLDIKRGEGRDIPRSTAATLPLIRLLRSAGVNFSCSPSAPGAGDA